MGKISNRYKARFAELAKRKACAFIPFVVLGDPNYNASFEILRALLRHADCLELGLPFSDPIADGKTIQAADQRALNNGMNTDRAFKLIGMARKLDSKIPIGLLVYYNLVYRRGISRFYRDAKRAGVDGILVADMPFEEAGEAMRAARRSGINQIFLVAQTTTDRRMKKILGKAGGFVYVVSVLGVTGARGRVHKETISLIRRAKRFTKLPLCVGFGISRPGHIKQLALAGADGAILGSALEDAIARNLKNRKRMLKSVDSFCRGMKRAAIGIKKF